MGTQTPAGLFFGHVPTLLGLHTSSLFPHVATGMVGISADGLQTPVGCGASNDSAEMLATNESHPLPGCATDMGAPFGWHPGVAK